jgi:hypothetical protein
MRWTIRLVLIFLMLWVIGGMWFYHYGASYGPTHFRPQMAESTPLGCDNQKQCQARLVTFLDSIR